MRGGYAETLEALTSTRVVVVRDAIGRLVELLRAGQLDEKAIAQIASRFVVIAGDHRWQIRKTLAEAVQYLQHESFHDVLGRLLDDSNAYVRDAARRVRARRSELIRTDVLKEQHGDLLMAWLSEFQARHDTSATKDAKQIAERYADVFVRGARHEITNVIASVELVLSNLGERIAKQRIDRRSCREDLQTAEARLRHLSGIVDSLREFTAEVKPEFHREGLREMVEQAVLLVRDSRRKKRWIDVEVVIDKQLRVDAHRHALVQAFQNVIRNAVEAYDGIRRPLPILVSARAVGHEIEISVRDRGCGMTPEVLRSAFFLYSSSKQDRGGTGFGLPLAKRYIEIHHGGRIDAVSEKGAGTTITLVLPLEQDRRD